ATQLHDRRLRPLHHHQRPAPPSRGNHAAPPLGPLVDSPARKQAAPRSRPELAKPIVADDAKNCIFTGEASAPAGEDARYGGALVYTVGIHGTAADTAAWQSYHAAE